jgi:hypothetical protein
MRVHGTHPATLRIRSDWFTSSARSLNVELTESA